MTEKKKEVKKFSEIVIKEFTDISKYKVRIVRPAADKDPVADIREYIETEKYKGFTRKGVRLPWDGLMTLEKILPELIKEMEKTPDAKK